MLVLMPGKAFYSIRMISNASPLRFLASLAIKCSAIVAACFPRDNGYFILKTLKVQKGLTLFEQT
jgi:hypothetical protein